MSNFRNPHAPCYCFLCVSSLLLYYLTDPLIAFREIFFLQFLLKALWHRSNVIPHVACQIKKIFMSLFFPHFLEIISLSNLKVAYVNRMLNVISVIFVLMSKGLMSILRKGPCRHVEFKRREPQ